MPWKRSEDVQRGDWLRDVGRVSTVGRPDRHGLIPMSVVPPPGDRVSAGGRTGRYHPATLAVGGIVETEDNPQIT